MRHSTAKKFAALTLFLFVTGAARFQEQQKMDPEKQKEEIIKIFKAEVLWGKGMPAALARLPSWAATEVKQEKVAIFPNMIVGTRPLKSTDEAKTDIKQLENAMQLKPGKLRPESQLILQNQLGAPPPPYHAEVHISRDDQKPRLAWVGKDVQFLKEGLSLAVVQEQLGKPMKVTREVIQTDGDRRPVTLTLHHYAGGAVTFAESDLSPQPGIVDRVILDVSAVRAALFSSE
jgi:hypothetical protein